MVVCHIISFPMPRNSRSRVGANKATFHMCPFSQRMGITELHTISYSPISSQHELTCISRLGNPPPSCRCGVTCEDGVCPVTPTLTTISTLLRIRPRLSTGSSYAETLWLVPDTIWLSDYSRSFNPDTSRVYSGIPDPPSLLVKWPLPFQPLWRRCVGPYTITSQYPTYHNFFFQVNPSHSSTSPPSVPPPLRSAHWGPRYSQGI